MKPWLQTGEGSVDGASPVALERGRRRALVVAVALTGLAFVQQAAYALGLVHGSPISTLQGSPLPLLLIAAPALALAARGVTPPARLRQAVAVLGRVPLWLGLLAVLSGTVALWAALQGALPYLGHDEAVYATQARSWAGGAPASGWAPYRPFGLPVLGWMALSFQSDVGALRLVGLGLALISLAIAYAVAARLTTPRRAVVAIAVFVSGWAFLKRLPEFLNDIAAAGLLLLVAYLIVRSRQRAGSYDLAVASAVAVVVFYLRYGAISGLVALAVAALLTWGPRVWIRSWREVAIAAGVFAGGLLPHLLYSERAAGSPLAAMLSAGDVAGGEYVGEGLVYYALAFPFRLAGDLGGVVMTAGLIAAAVSALRIRRGELEGRGDRVRVFFGLTAVLHVVVLGLTAHGEERYVFFPVLLLIILGVDAIAEFAGASSRVVLAALTSFAVVAAAANYGVVRDGHVADVTAERTSLVQVGDLLARQSSASRTCVVATAYQPQLGWYSGCATIGLTQVAGTRPVAGQLIYVVLFDEGRGQRSERGLSRFMAGRVAGSQVLDTRGSLGAARVITLR